MFGRKKSRSPESLQKASDYFREWAKSKKLTDQTVKKLTKEDFNDFDALRAATELQLTALTITGGQLALLISAVAELKSFHKTEDFYKSFLYKIEGGAMGGTYKDGLKPVQTYENIQLDCPTSDGLYSETRPEDNFPKTHTPNPPRRHMPDVPTSVYYEELPEPVMSPRPPGKEWTGVRTSVYYEAPPEPVMSPRPPGKEWTDPIYTNVPTQAVDADKYEHLLKTPTELDDDDMLLTVINNHRAREYRELDVQIGDILRVLPSEDHFHEYDNENTADNLDNYTHSRIEWIYAENTRTGKTGNVPSTHVVTLKDQKRSKEWWFDIDRREANHQLLLSGNTDGTFLIRNGKDEDTYVLSIRWLDPSNMDAMGIRHYKIKFSQRSHCYYIYRTKQFETLDKLIEHYKENEMLCCKLGKVCLKEPELVPFRDIEIKKDSLKMMTPRLGAGAFGEVFKATWRNQIDVAVKTLKPGTMDAKQFLDEAKNMQRLHHRKIVQLMGVCTEGEGMYIVTEFMINGSLKTYLRTKKSETLGFATLIDMAAQVSDGMSYLEHQKVVHRDVRADNMLVGNDNIVKVADFGLAHLLGASSEITKFPLKWTAPEAFLHHRFTIKSDAWSFGILLYEIVTYGGEPYPRMQKYVVKNKVQDGYKMKNPEGCPDDVYLQMCQCWDLDPSRRPSFGSLHAFFTTYKVGPEVTCVGSRFMQEDDFKYIDVVNTDST